jgi:hypothetical protein
MLRASIASLAFVALIGPTSAFDLVVINDANLSIIHKLYIAPAKSNKWGDDKLQSQTVVKNGRFTVRDVAGGVYDLKVVDDDDDTCVVSNINIDKSTEWRLTDAIMLKCTQAGCLKIDHRRVLGVRARHSST